MSHSILKLYQLVDNINLNVQVPSTGRPSIEILPVEIVAEIFVHCLPEDLSSRNSIQEAPLLLGRICRAWRRLALHTPRLWAGFRLSNVSRKNPQFLADAMKEWVGRSQSCPLSFSIEYYGDSAKEDWTRAIDSVVECVLPHSRRWKHVVSKLAELPSLWQRLLSAFSNGTPLLETFSLSGCYLGFQQIVLDLSAAPRITALHVIRVNIGFQPSEMVSHGLRELLMPYAMTTLNSVWTVLCQCPRMTKFEVQVGFDRKSRHILPGAGVVTLTHLESFHLSIPDQNVISGPLFDRLHLPALTSLRIGLPTADFPFCLPHLTRLLQRSSCLLTTVTIKSLMPAATEVDLSDFLQQTPHLKTLIIESLTLSENTFVTLVAPSSVNSTPHACPNLETLRLLECLNIPTGIVAAVILSRYNPLPENIRVRTTSNDDVLPARQSPGRLRSVTVYYCDPGLLFNYPGISACVRSGLDLCVADLHT